MAPAEAWQIVDASAKRVFGRTAAEELETDLNFEEQLFEPRHTLCHRLTAPCERATNLNWDAEMARMALLV